MQFCSGERLPLIFKVHKNQTFIFISTKKYCPEAVSLQTLRQLQRKVLNNFEEESLVTGKKEMEKQEAGGKHDFERTISRQSHEYKQVKKKKNATMRGLCELHNKNRGGGKGNTIILKKKKKNDAFAPYSSYTQFNPHNWA